MKESMRSASKGEIIFKYRAQENERRAARREKNFVDREKGQVPSKTSKEFEISGGAVQEKIEESDL
jgi:hypothetical protein